MATAKKQTKRPKTVTLYFEDKDTCTRACEMLGLSLRKVADIDRTHKGDYSKATGHYGLITRGGDVLRVKLRSKLMVEDELYRRLSDEQRSQLGHRDVTSVGWIVP